MDAYHHGNLKADLLTRARTMIETVPGAAPSLRELARQAGVSATAVYHHFPSKEDLLAEVGASLLEELMADWDRLTLEELGQAYLGFFRSHPSALGLVFGPRLRKVPRIRELQDKAYTALIERLPPGPDGPDHRAGLAVWALVQGLAHLYADGALGADPEECPGGPALWYQEPPAVMAALAPLLEKMLTR
ncbi:MAG: TetR/AcrR family transcriptional regulator [Spirochaetota bacterium]